MGDHLSSPVRSQYSRMQRFIIVFLPISTTLCSRSPCAPQAQAVLDTLDCQQPGRAVSAHPADLLELLGAHIVGVHDEQLVVVLHVAAQPGVILHAQPGGQRNCPVLITEREIDAERTSSFLLSFAADGIVWEKV